MDARYENEIKTTKRQYICYEYKKYWHVCHDSGAYINITTL